MKSYSSPMPHDYKKQRATSTPAVPLHHDRRPGNAAALLSQLYDPILSATTTTTTTTTLCDDLCYRPAISISYVSDSSSSCDGDATPPLDVEEATPLSQKLMLASTYSGRSNTGIKRKRTTTTDTSHSHSKSTTTTSLDRLLQVSQDHRRRQVRRPRLPSVSEFVSTEDLRVVLGCPSLSL